MMAEICFKYLVDCNRDEDIPRLYLTLSQLLAHKYKLAIYNFSNLKNYSLNKLPKHKQVFNFVKDSLTMIDN